MHLGNTGRTSQTVTSPGGRTSIFWPLFDCENNFDAVLHLLVFFLFAGMQSHMQERFICCLSLFLAHALQFTHEHLGVVPFPSQVRARFEHETTNILVCDVHCQWHASCKCCVLPWLRISPKPMPTCQHTCSLTLHYATTGKIFKIKPTVN